MNEDERRAEDRYLAATDFLFGEVRSSKNIRLYYSEKGEGPPLLILHGFAHSHMSWFKTADELSRFYRVIVFDLPGFGKSDTPSLEKFDYSFAELGNLCLDLAAALSLTRFALFGHDLGATIALHLGIEHPNMISQLIFCSPTFTRFGVWNSLSYFPFAKGFYLKRRVKQLVKEASLFHENKDRMNPPWEIWESIWKGMQDTELHEAALTRVSLPSMVVWGRLDPFYSLADAKRVQRRLPGSRLAVLEYKRTPNVECPSVLANVVHQFLQTDKTPPPPSVFAKLQNLT